MLVGVGVISMALGVATLLLWYVNIPVAAHGGHDLSKLWVMAVWLLGAGAGLVFGNRFAALALSIPCAAFWCWWVVGAAVDGSMISVGFAIVFAVIYLAPLTLSIAGWHLLGWSKWRAVA